MTVEGYGTNPANKLKSVDLDGLVWILEGKVCVKNEIKNGMPPLLNPCDGVILKINNVECNHLTAVSENDHIELISIDSEIELKTDVEVSEDGLYAYLNFSPPKIVKNIVVDTYPVNKLDINATEVVISTKKVKEDDIREALSMRGVIFGILDSVIEDICNTNKPGRYLVAEGKPQKEPIDDWVEYFFDETKETEFKIIKNSSDTADFKNSISYITVSPGEIIAKLHKSESGENGITVTGEEIICREPNNMVILQSNSIIFEAESGIIRCRKSGRPTKVVKGNTVVFNVFDKLVVDEVSMKTGNVRFKGDVEVNGNVLESMEVVARQNILIKGNANFSSIYAGNNVTIKGGLISGRIFTGANDKVARDPSDEINKIIIEINNLINSINELSQRDVQGLNLKGMPDIIHFLLNTKNRGMPNTIYEVINQLNKGNYDIDEGTLLQLIKRARVFLTDCSEVTNIDYLYHLMDSLKGVFFVKEDIRVSGNVEVGYILNSDISALGNVTVTGRGCFNARINARGRVVVSGSVRAGEIFSEKSIEVNKVGAEIGVKTLLSVPENGSIYIKVAYVDTTIKIGGASHMFLKEQKSVNAKFFNGKIVF